MTQTDHKYHDDNGEPLQDHRQQSTSLVNRKQWASNVRTPFVLSFSCGAALGCLSSVMFYGGRALVKTASVQGMSFGLIGFCYFGTREYLNMRWQRLQMVERLTLSSVLSGFVAGCAYRAFVLPIVDMEHAISKEMAEEVKKMTAEERKVLRQSLRSVTLRSVLGFGLAGAVLALAATKSHQWWTFHKHDKLERMKKLEQVIERAEKERFVSEETMNEIEEAEREQRGFFKRKWNQFTGMLSFEIPDWIREDSNVRDLKKHKDEMEHIYREFENMKLTTPESESQHVNHDNTEKKE